MSTNPNIPHRLNAQDLTRLRSLCETLATAFGESLSILLRAEVQASVENVEQIGYGRFLRTLDAPSCFCVLKSERFDHRPLFCIEQKVVQPMIDRLLGGSCEEPPQLDRPLTEIELCLAARIVRLFLRECRNVWQAEFDLNLDILQTDNTRRSLQISPIDDMAAIVNFEVTVCRSHGVVHFCLPVAMLENILDEAANNAGELAEESAPSTLAEVSVLLAETRIAGDELSEVGVGDIIATETALDAPAVVAVDGVPRFHAKPGVYRGRKAACITEAIDDCK
jgi:flagellar motor switch protein FliM